MYIVISGTAAFGCLACCSSDVAPILSGSKLKPNFVIVIADDLGYSDLSCYGSTFIRTPILDSLARNGLMFTDAHSNGSVSTPTRTAFMTGRYQQRAGMDGVLLENIPEHRFAGLQPDQVTFAEILSRNGYRTALMGKWHLGFDQKYNPMNYGFNEFIGFMSGNVDYISRVSNSQEMDWWSGREKLYCDGYTTDLISDNAISFIKRNKDKPFCLIVSQSCPHDPLQGRNDPVIREEGKPHGPFILPGRSQKEIYKEMVEIMDTRIGDIVKTLRDEEIDENTLFVFISDNGPLMNDVGSAVPFKGGKGTIFEGGHRIPWIMYMPGVIEKPSVSSELIMTMDLFPTLLEMSGYDPDRLEKKIDGESLVPVMKGKSMSKRTVFWSYGPKSAVRSGGWKFIRQRVKTKSGIVTSRYLIDISNDKEEKHNVIEQYSGVASRLEKHLDEWLKDVTSEEKEQLTPYIPSLSF